MLCHIVAVSENNVIGFQGQLPWSLPEDMKFFKDTTKGHSLIMGRKTFEALPQPLPHRLNVIITRNKNYSPSGAIVTHSLNEAIDTCKDHSKEYKGDIFIIGGGEIYKQSLEIVDRIYLTRIHRSFEGDTKYPVISPANFKEVACLQRTEPIPFSFLTYEKTSFQPEPLTIKKSES